MVEKREELKATRGAPKLAPTPEPTKTEEKKRTTTAPSPVEAAYESITKPPTTPTTTEKETTRAPSAVEAAEESLAGGFMPYAPGTTPTPKPPVPSHGTFEIASGVVVSDPESHPDLLLQYYDPGTVVSFGSRSAIITQTGQVKFYDTTELQKKLDTMNWTEAYKLGFVTKEEYEEAKRQAKQAREARAGETAPSPAEAAWEAKFQPKRVSAVSAVEAAMESPMYGKAIPPPSAVEAAEESLRAQARRDTFQTMYKTDPVRALEYARNWDLITKKQFYKMLPKAQEDEKTLKEESRFIVSFQDHGTEVAKVFRTKEAADAYIEGEKRRFLKSVGWEVPQEEILRAGLDPWKEYERHVETVDVALDRLKSAGAAKQDPLTKKVTLTTPLQNLPEHLYEDAKTVGFTGDYVKGLSFKLLEWQKKAYEDFDPKYRAYLEKVWSSPEFAGVRARVRVGSGPPSYVGPVIVGEAERTIHGVREWPVIGPAAEWANDVCNSIEHTLTGKGAVAGRPGVRTVSAETIKYIRDLSPGQLRQLRIAGVGGVALGTYVLTAPIGFVTAKVISGAKAIAVAKGITAPAAMAQIANEIAKHPRAVQLVLYGTMVGLSSQDMAQIYDRYKKGDLSQEDLAFIIAERAAAFGAGIAGFKTGVDIERTLREWWAARGRTLIPIEELLRKETLEGIQTGRQQFPEWDKAHHSKEFIETAKRLTEKGYLGDVAPGEYYVWHTTGDPWNVRLEEVTTARYGDTKPLDAKGLTGFLRGVPLETVKKWPGLFVCAEPSPYFWRTGGGYGARLTLPGLGGVPYTVAFPALIDVMPSGMSKAQLWKWVLARAGEKTVYIPPVSMISSEMEGVLPGTTPMVCVGQGWYTSWTGHYVLIDKYLLLPSDIKLDALPKGMKIETLSEVTSKIQVPKEELYIAWGLTPSYSMYAGAELTEDMVKALAKAYNISEVEVRSIVRSLAPSVAELTESLRGTGGYPSFTVEKLKELLEYRSDPFKPPSISGTSRPKAEPKEISSLSDKELTNILSSLSGSALSSTISSLAPSQMSRLSDKQISSLTPDQISRLSREQISALLYSSQISPTTIEYILRYTPYIPPYTPPYRPPYTPPYPPPSYPGHRYPSGYPSGYPYSYPGRGKLIEDISRKLRAVPSSRFLETYKVTFQYYMSSEVHRVHARSFNDAIRLGFKLKKKPDEPEGVEVRKLIKLHALEVPKLEIEPPTRYPIDLGWSR